MAALLNLVALPGGGGAAVVRAQDAESTLVARAESYAAAAFDAYSRRDYQHAVALYLLALEAAPSADILYNVARIYDTRIKDRQHAIDYYARYVADPRADPKRLQACAERLAVLREQQQIADAVSREASVAAAASGRHVPVAPRSESGLTTVQGIGVGVAAVGVAGIGSGVGFGLSAKSDADVVHMYCKGDACATQRGVDAARHGTEMALISTVAFVAGGALLVGAATMFLLGGRASGREEERVSVTPLIDRTSLGLHLHGRL